VCTHSEEGVDRAESQTIDVSPDILEAECHDVSSATMELREHARIYVSREELLKKMRQFNWTVRSSSERRIYFRCYLKSCEVEIKAHQINDKGGDDEWALYGAHTNHPCGSGVKNVTFNGMYCSKDSLPEDVCTEIEHLGASGAFDSKSIQKHLLKQNPNMLVDTRLIQNMAYRVKQKLFGSKGDIAHLLEQQQVAVDQVCTHIAL
jgi:hypothetical protein